MWSYFSVSFYVCNFGLETGPFVMSHTSSGYWSGLTFFSASCLTDWVILGAPPQSLTKALMLLPRGMASGRPTVPPPHGSGFGKALCGPCPHPAVKLHSQLADCCFQQCPGQKLLLLRPIPLHLAPLKKILRSVLEVSAGDSPDYNGPAVQPASPVNPVPDHRETAVQPASTSLHDVRLLRAPWARLRLVLQETRSAP